MTDTDLSARALPRPDEAAPTGAEPCDDTTDRATDESTAADGDARRCGYSACDRHLSYDGRGRPPRYCDRVWPDGQSCAQRAKAERAAARGLGVAEPLAAYAATTDRLLPAVESLRAALAAVHEQVGLVGAGALAHQEAQEQTTTDALHRAERAAAEATEARRVAAIALRRGEEAAAARAQAERLQQEAVRRAADAEAAAARADARLDALTARHEDLVARHTQLTADLAAARLQTRTAEVAAADSATRAATLDADVAALRTTLALAEERSRSDERRAADAEDGRRRAERHATEAVGAVELVRAGAAADRAAEETRAAAARQRVTDLETELATLRRTSAAEVAATRAEAQRRVDEVRADTEALRALLGTLRPADPEP